ncbi:MAG TPA: helix-turn-helix domain-containing protein [Ktedonobacteraceae bacterium]|nr:helix-turn-helix domain-containing protein [Ktedonobacteraceae bacterium]
MATDNSHRQMGQSVGAKLRAARQAKKYTQSQLASPDFSVSYISAIERGQIHPSLRALEILARRLELSSTQLLLEHSPGENGTSHTVTPLFDDEIGTELALIEAQISILCGTASEAITQLKKLPSRTLHAQHRIRHRYLLGWAYFLTAEMQNCEDALLEVEKLAVEHNECYSRLHAANLLGIAYATMSNHQQALQAHHHCLELLKDVQPADPFFLCQLYNHLGQHYTNLNDFNAALTMFNQAITLAESFSSQEQLQTTYWTIAQHYSQAQELHLALLYTHKCLHLYQQPIKTPVKSDIYYFLGRALMQSDQETARTFLEETLQQTNHGLDELSQASIMIRLAESSLQRKEIAQAEQFTKQAAQLAAPFGDTLIAAEALLIWGRIDYAQQQYEEGDKHFVAGLAMLEHLHLDEEVADQSALYAQLLDEREQLPQAIVYYKRAFESRRRIGSYN